MEIIKIILWTPFHELTKISQQAHAHRQMAVRPRGPRLVQVHQRAARGHLEVSASEPRGPTSAGTQEDPPMEALMLRPDWLALRKKAGTSPPFSPGHSGSPCKFPAAKPCLHPLHLPLLWPASPGIPGDITHPGTNLSVFKCFHEKLTFCCQLISSPE